LAFYEFNDLFLCLCFYFYFLEKLQFYGISKKQTFQKKNLAIKKQNFPNKKLFHVKLIFITYCL